MCRSFVARARSLRMPPGGWWCVLALVGLCGAQSIALAEASVPPGYQEAVNQALSELEANNLPEALTEFRRAHALYPNARSLRGMGMVEFDLRDYRTSAKHLQEALASSVKPLAGKLRTDTETLLDRALRYLGEVRLITDPSDVTILVDGAPAELRADGVLLLNVGEHTIELQAPGRLTETRSVQIAGGDKRQLRVTLGMVSAKSEQAPVARAPQQEGPFVPQSDEPSDQPAPVYKKWWLWTVVAVVVVGGGATAALLLTRDEKPKRRPIEGDDGIGVTLTSLSRF